MSFAYGKDLDTLLLLYPGLVGNIVKDNEVVLKGPVKLKDQWYQLHVSCPAFPRLKSMQCQVQQIHEFKSFTTETTGVNTEWSISELIQQLPKLLSENVTNDQEENVERNVDVYREIVDLCTTSQGAYRIQMNANHSRVRFSAFVDHLEQHFIELELPALFVRTHSLPDCIPWHALHKCDNVTAIIAHFQKYLDVLQPFYDSFVEIDELCHVVQPITPTTKHNWRIFKLRDRVFLKLIITDPLASFSSMAVRIIGPTHDVEQLRQTYSEGLQNWDPDISVHKNLLRIFDLCFFPMPPQSNDVPMDDCESEENECKICYCYLLDSGEVPFVSCDNAHCSLMFHVTCLREWFKILNNEVFLEVYFGACPFCKAKMSTSFAELLNIE